MDIAAKAWNQVKGPGDAEYDLIPNIEFKGKLDFAAERVKATGVAETNFEKAVKDILDKQDPAPMANEEAKVIEPDQTSGVGEGLDAAGDSEGHAEEAKKLAKDNDRKGLEKLAKKAGLDGNSYTNKQELAEAIVAAQLHP